MQPRVPWQALWGGSEVLLGSTRLLLEIITGGNLSQVQVLGNCDTIMSDSQHTGHIFPCAAPTSVSSKVAKTVDAAIAMAGHPTEHPSNGNKAEHVAWSHYFRLFAGNELLCTMVVNGN